MSVLEECWALSKLTRSVPSFSRKTLHRRAVSGSAICLRHGLLLQGTSAFHGQAHAQCVLHACGGCQPAVTHMLSRYQDRCSLANERPVADTQGMDTLPRLDVLAQHDPAASSAQPVPPADYDSPWKEALEQYFPDFLAFFFPLVHAEIAWEHGYEFLDTELERVVRDATIGRRYADKLVKVFLRAGQETWLLIHVEIQGYPDPDFAQRMFVYYYRIFDR